MKNLDDIEKFVRCGKPNVNTGEQMKKQTLGDSYVAMKKAIKSTSKDSKSGMFKFAVHNRVMKLLAAAAVVIVIIGLFMIHPAPDKKVEIAETANAKKSPAEMLTLRSLKIAYRNGGIEAVETQCDNAIEKLGPKSKIITAQELLIEINGV